MATISISINNITNNNNNNNNNNKDNNKDNTNPKNIINSNNHRTKEAKINNANILESKKVVFCGYCWSILNGEIFNLFRSETSPPLTSKIVWRWPE